MPTRTHIQPFLDPKTWTVSYVTNDIATRSAAVIDPVLDCDFKSGHTDTVGTVHVAGWSLCHTTPC